MEIAVPSTAIIASVRVPILALLTHHTPVKIADERERIQEMLDLLRQYSDQAQEKMLGYVQEFKSRIVRLPGKIEARLGQNSSGIAPRRPKRDILPTQRA